jgi:hypothetical protein
MAGQTGGNIRSWIKDATGKHELTPDGPPTQFLGRRTQPLEVDVVGPMEKDDMNKRHADEERKQRGRSQLVFQKQLLHPD